MFPAGPGLSAGTLGDPNAAYDGPAVLERQDPGNLTFAIAGDANASAADAALPRHVTVSGLGGEVAFARGARVWLTEGVEGPGVNGFAVRDEQGGRLLFATTAGTDSPVALMPGVGPPCVERDDEICVISGTITHGSLRVGDDLVEIPDGQTRVVKIGGFDYDVTVTAWTSKVEQANQTTCWDGPTPGTYSTTKVDVRARDLAAIAAGLGTADLPACVEGNAPFKESSFFLGNVDGSTHYAGPVTYEGRGQHEAGDDCYDFSTIGLAPTVGLSPPVLEVCATSGLVAEPTVGATLWATVDPIASGTLRASEHGAFLLASAWGQSVYATAAALQRGLGVYVNARSRCAYATVQGQPSFLYDFDLVTTPPATVSEDDTATFTLDGLTYGIWSNRSENSITVAPR
jgi:hypothetical protein